MRTDIPKSTSMFLVHQQVNFRVKSKIYTPCHIVKLYMIRCQESPIYVNITIRPLL